MKVPQVYFQHVAVTERLLTDVAHVRLDAGVLCEMSLQVVCRRKPPPTVRAPIGVMPLMHRHVNPQGTVTRELFATFATPSSQSQHVNTDGKWRLVLVHRGLTSGVRQQPLEHKHAFIRRPAP